MQKTSETKNILEKYKRRIVEKDALLASQKTQILKSKREMDFMRPFFLQINSVSSDSVRRENLHVFLMPK